MRDLSCFVWFMIVNKGNDREDREVKVARTPTTDAKEKGTLSDDDLDDLVAAFGNVGFANKICTLCQTSYRPTIKESKFCLECEGVFKGYSEHNSSTKIIKIIELLKQMKVEDPERKAIVFSQFTSFFDILRPFLKRAGIKFVVCECKILLSHFCRFLYMLALDWQFLLMLCYSTTRL